MGMAPMPAALTIHVAEFAVVNMIIEKTATYEQAHARHP